MAAPTSCAMRNSAARPRRYTSRLSRPFSTPFMTPEKAANTTPATITNRDSASSISMSVKPS